MTGKKHIRNKLATSIENKQTGKQSDCYSRWDPESGRISKRPHFTHNIRPHWRPGQ